MTPRGGKIEEIGGEVFDRGVGKALARSANCGFGNVEGGGTKAPGGELVGIVAQTAADGEGGLSRGWLRMRFPKFKQAWIGAEIGPRNSALPCFGLLIKRFEPTGRVTLPMEFGG